jgi:hypothetical protein
MYRKPQAIFGQLSLIFRLLAPPPQDVAKSAHGANVVGGKNGKAVMIVHAYLHLPRTFITRKLWAGSAGCQGLAKGDSAAGLSWMGAFSHHWTDKCLLRSLSEEHGAFPL